MSIKAYQLMALAAENPQKYTGKKYRVVSGHATHLFGAQYDTVEVSKDYNTDGGVTLVGVSKHGTTSELVAVTTRTILEEIIEGKQVSFMDAVKACDDGTIIYCKHCGETTEYNDHGWLTDQLGRAVSTTEILRGKWYIKGA